MTKLIADMSMSLDGKIAAPDDDATMLFDWFFGGDTEVGPFRVSGAAPSCSPRRSRASAR